MKCPLLHTTFTYPSGGQELDHEDCLAKNCAWWHTYLDKNNVYWHACVLIHIADKLEVKK